MPPSPAHTPTCVVCGPHGGMAPLSQEALALGKSMAERQRRYTPCPSPTLIALKKPPAAGGGGGRAWGLPAQQACGSCSKPLGRGLTSSQLCETPGGFLTSSNGRVGVGWGRHRPRCQLLPAQAQALCCLPPAPLLHPHPHPLTVRKIQHL